MRDLGLERAPDEAVWAQAAAGGFLIAAKDGDFLPLSTLRGPPPKVVWVRLGNCTTAEVEALLRERYDDGADEREAILVLGRRK